MPYYIIKLVITAALIVFISEISKRSSFIGGLLASLPTISFFAMIWLYVDTKDVVKISALATSIFWLVLPSLSLFILLPIMLKHRINFYTSLATSTAVMIGCYSLMVFALHRFGIRL